MKTKGDRVWRRHQVKEKGLGTWGWQARYEKVTRKCMRHKGSLVRFYADSGSPRC